MLPAASQTMRAQLLQLTVRITDADGAPVNDVPVHFRIPQAQAVLADVDPPTVLTQNGQATTAFRARAVGQITVEITVENLTEIVRIAVLGDTPRF
jgi:hypothetical protein